MLCELSPDVLAAQLRGAISELTCRGLKQSAKWAAELLVGLPRSASSSSASSSASSSSSSSSSSLAEAGEPDSDAFLLARTYFDLGEYQRTAWVLEQDELGVARGGTGLVSRRGMFLRMYSLFLAGEKRKEEEIVELADPLQRCQVVNRKLNELHAELSRLPGMAGPGGGAGGEAGGDAGGMGGEGGEESLEAGDGFLMYLYGVVLREMDHAEDARAALIRSVNLYPWNWSAWVDLAALHPLSASGGTVDNDLIR